MSFRKLAGVLGVLAMVVVAGCGSAERTSSDKPPADVRKENALEVGEKRMTAEARQTRVAPARGEGEAAATDESEPDAPKNKNLKLTVPRMERIREDVVPTTVGTDEAALRDFAAIHVKGTGYPWEDRANVYIAGHRIGYPNTESYLTFYDLNVLEEGDGIHLEDANGTRYTYRVTRKFVADPLDVFIAAAPEENKNVISLQSCTLPDYSKRLVVRGELVSS